MNQLLNLCLKKNLKPSVLFKQNYDAYKILKAKIGEPIEDEILDLMFNNLELMQRLIAEKGVKVILAQSPERIMKVF